ncbi:MAG TPA: hydrogenase expression protein HypE [Gammaproteobacteria bacterium]|nr:hydrogenase expression protein HypE [Gammaproteobacteria bacterium]
MSANIELRAHYRRVEGHRPWPRFIVDAEAWSALAEELGAGRRSLLGFWGEPGAVHMAVLERDEILVASLACPDGRFPSLGVHHAPARRLERAIRDLFGLEAREATAGATGSIDARPWLDHGRWGIRAPLGRSPTSAPADGSAYAFLPAEGESLHEVPVGPVHAGIIEPGHFRITAAGETLVRLEARLGYVHKGIEGLMAGAGLDRAARLAGRTSGDSTVAYAFAFAHAAEAALGLEIPPRARRLRAFMAELERLANHLGDIGAICNDAAFALMHAHCGILREQVLRAADAAFGHRLMRDAIVPGGVSVDLDSRGSRTIAALIGEIRRRFPALAALYENTASLQNRTVGAGVLAPSLALQYAAGGPVGRASGRNFDARRATGYPPYDELSFEVPVRTEGDVDARIRIRMLEIEQSLAMLEQLLQHMPSGSRCAALPSSTPAGFGEGMALVEGFRGDILVWLELDSKTRVARCHLRDPSWFQWPLLEAAIEGNIVADFPLVNKSFNCSYSGQDL